MQKEDGVVKRIFWFELIALRLSKNTGMFYLSLGSEENYLKLYYLHFSNNYRILCTLQ